MAGYTREIFTVTSDGRRGAYAGYARFGADGSYKGSHGGYNSRGEKATRTDQQNYNSNKGGGSRVQNTIKTVGSRGKARNSLLF